MDKNVELLEYIYQDADMGVKSLTNLINAINNKGNKIKKLVEEKLKGYEEILKKSKKLLKDYQAEPKSKGLKADLGSLMGIKMELMKDNSDARIADMIIKGFTMGIIDAEKRIDKYKKEVDRKVLNIAKEIKEFQEQGIKDLKAYL